MITDEDYEEVKKGNNQTSFYNVLYKIELTNKEVYFIYGHNLTYATRTLFMNLDFFKGENHGLKIESVISMANSTHLGGLIFVEKEHLTLVNDGKAVNLFENLNEKK